MTKIVYIEWCDAIASGLEWMEKAIAQEWGKNSEWIIQEVGWLLEDTKEYLVIASARKPEDEYTEEQYKHLMKIPKTWIRKRIDLSDHIS